MVIRSLVGIKFNYSSSAGVEEVREWDNEKEKVPFIDLTSTGTNNRSCRSPLFIVSLLTKNGFSFAAASYLNSLYLSMGCFYDRLCLPLPLLSYIPSQPS